VIPNALYIRSAGELVCWWLRMVFSISFFWWATWSWCSFDDWFILYGKAATNCLVHRYVSPCLVISNFRLGSACIVIKNIFNKMSTSSLWNTPAIVCQPFGVLFPFLPWPNVFYGIFYIIYRTSPAWVSPFLLLLWGRAHHIGLPLGSSGVPRALHYCPGVAHPNQVNFNHFN
jgi:hypothetical protein